jgi:hypothetical protein
VDAGGAVAAGPVVYGVNLGEDGRARYDGYAEMRTWDPCALLDPAALAAVGEVSSQSSRSGFDTCYAYAAPPGATRYAEWRLRVSLDPDFPDFERREATPRSIGGRDVLSLPQTSPEDCDLVVPIDGDRVVELDVGWSGSGAPPATGCSVAEPLVAAMVPLLADPVRRSEGRYPVATPLAVADPCAGIAAYTARGEAVQWDLEDGDLTRCRFTLGSGRDAPDLEVTLGSAPEAVETPDNGDTAVQVRGFDAVESPSSSGSSCRVRVFGRTPVPEGGLGGDDDTVVEEVQARADTCEQATQLADATVPAVGLR